MALSLMQCPKASKLPDRSYFLKVTSLPPQPTFLRVAGMRSLSGKGVLRAASSAAGNSGANDSNPYEVLGVNPLAGFDTVKAAYANKRKNAERIGDETAAAELEKAYDKIMMSQLSKRKKGETFGSFQVSKDIKYADKQPFVPWGPRFAKSEVKDIRINLAISAVFSAWIFVSGAAEYKPLQFLAFVFFYRIFEKLKAYEPAPSSTFIDEAEDTGRMMRMGKRLLRSIVLVFGCLAFTSLGYTAALNCVEYAAGYIPVFLYNNQELLVTVSSALLLHVLASYYR